MPGRPLAELKHHLFDDQNRQRLLRLNAGPSACGIETDDSIELSSESA